MIVLPLRKVYSENRSRAQHLILFGGGKLKLSLRALFFFLKSRGKIMMIYTKLRCRFFWLIIFHIPVFSKLNMLLSDTFMFRDWKRMGVASFAGTRRHVPLSADGYCSPIKRRYPDRRSIWDLPSQTHTLQSLFCPPPPQAPPALVLLCILWKLHNEFRYLMYPMGDCIMFPVFKCWCAVGILYRKSVCRFKSYSRKHQKKVESHRQTKLYFHFMQ